MPLQRWPSRSRGGPASRPTQEQAANHIVRGWGKGRFEIDFPKRFSLWMRFMRLLPNNLYFAAVRRATGT